MNDFSKAVAFTTILFTMACGTTKRATENNGEWVNMLRGNTLKGWHKYNKPGTVGSAWSVNDGVLYLDDSKKDQRNRIIDGGNIVYDGLFENFHLKLEWKISPGGNSGILFLVHEDTMYREPYETGPEMQILDNNVHSDGKIHKHRSGDLYDLIACSRETIKPVNEWNAAEIILKDAKLEFILNGEKVVSTVMWDDAWNQMIAGSKFKNWKGFAAYRKGKIVLQDHDNGVWFRNMKIRKL